MRQLSSSQSLFLSVTLGFLLTLPVALWLRQRGLEDGQQPKIGSIESIPGIKPGESVRVRSFRDLQGGVVDPWKRENYVILSFFSASSCPKCGEEAELWKNLVARGEQRDTAAFFVATDTDPRAISGFLEANGLSGMPVLYDPKGNVFEHFKIQFLPQYLLFDATGKLIHRDLGYTGARGLEPAERARKILNALPSPARAQAASSTPSSYDPHHP